MGKDLIIGGASNYTWDQLKYWVNSIKQSGFDGDVVLVATNITKTTIDKLTDRGVILDLYGKQDEEGNVVAHTNGAPHVERFFYIWNYLNKNGYKYDYVISTDTRDVVFQTNPSKWLDENVLDSFHRLIASSEGMKYEDEPWNSNNLDQAFGPFFHNQYKGMMINNVGVLAGEPTHMQDMFFMIFQMSINRPIPIVDQAVFNILLQQSFFKESFKMTTNLDGWAIQLGTTLEAVSAGFGDIGATVAQNPTKLILYQTKYADQQPTITEDGIVVNNSKQPFCIVHQYDRVPRLHELVINKYGD